MALKKAIQLYTITEDKITHTKDMSIPEPAVAVVSSTPTPMLVLPSLTCCLEVCVALKKTIQLYTFTQDKIMHTKGMSIPEPALAVVSSTPTPMLVPPSLASCLEVCVALKKKIQLYTITEDKIMHIKDMSIPEPTLAVVGSTPTPMLIPPSLTCCLEVCVALKKKTI